MIAQEKNLFNWSKGDKNERSIQNERLTILLILIALILTVPTIVLADYRHYDGECDYYRYSGSLSKSSGDSEAEMVDNNDTCRFLMEHYPN